MWQNTFSFAIDGTSDDTPLQEQVKMFFPDGFLSADKVYSAALFVEHVTPRTFLSCKMCKTIQLRTEVKGTLLSEAEKPSLFPPPRPPQENEEAKMILKNGKEKEEWTTAVEGRQKAR